MLLVWGLCTGQFPLPGIFSFQMLPLSLCFSNVTFSIGLNIGRPLLSCFPLSQHLPAILRYPLTLCFPSPPVLTIFLDTNYCLLPY